MTIVEAVRGVTGGVDTNLDVHVAAAVDPLGALRGSESFETTPAGYKALLAWLEGFGDVTKAGMKGAGSYDAVLARYRRRAHVEIIEVNWLTSAQQWAIRVLTQAGIELQPLGPVMVRGMDGPPSPYIPSGAYG
jgi:hypothetical protein